ncbi:MAG: methylated-DNA--[protein]-cysteine S-methyltransferase [Verrucomicrobiae bacterium]|nr:methylated-DNA--[protein]-cysteine S-methyltransferase [Verrucomicrobiae bacterium]
MSGELAMDQASMDYDRVERAIAYLESHHLDQPDLTTVARHVHLSEYHFQRLFSRWAGISPKRFLQCLTVEHAKHRLAESKALLDVTLESGLSSPGRLHDLFVAVEAMTPGEFKEEGAGLQIRYGLHPSPFGTCLVAMTDRGVCSLAFVDRGGESDAIDELRTSWAGARLSEQPRETGPVAASIFNDLNRGRRSELGLLLKGTNFQVKVWKALLRISPGAVVSYETLARWTCGSRAARAVANAVGANPIAYLIPCHRVIRRTGVVTGYRWGSERKRAILAWEAGRSNLSARRNGRRKFGNKPHASPSIPFRSISS